MASFMPQINDPFAQNMTLAINQAGSSLAQALVQKQQQALEKQDMATFLAHQQYQSAAPEQKELMERLAFASGSPLPMGARRHGEMGGAPQFKSEKFNAIQQNIALQQQLSQILNPVQEQQIEGIKATTEATKASTGIRKQLAPHQIKALATRTGLTEAQIGATISGTKIAEDMAPGQLAAQDARTKYNTALMMGQTERNKYISKMSPKERKQFRLNKRESSVDRKYRKALTTTEKGKAALLKAQASGVGIPDTEFERNLIGLPVEQQLTAKLIRLGLEPGNAKVRQMPSALLDHLQNAREAYFIRRDEKDWGIGQLQSKLYRLNPAYENYRAQIDAFIEGLQLEESPTKPGAK